MAETRAKIHSELGVPVLNSPELFVIGNFTSALYFWLLWCLRYAQK